MQAHGSACKLMDLHASSWIYMHSGTIWNIWEYSRTLVFNLELRQTDRWAEISMTDITLQCKFTLSHYLKRDLLSCVFAAQNLSDERDVMLLSINI